MIDVHDCNVRLPSSGDPNDLYMDELVRLSVILGQVLKTIYRLDSRIFNIPKFTSGTCSPSGLTHTDDNTLRVLLRDIDAWKENLPQDLKYRGIESSKHAGVLSFAPKGELCWG
jgi:hypothetical protein